MKTIIKKLIAVVIFLFGFSSIAYTNKEKIDFPVIDKMSTVIAQEKNHSSFKRLRLFDFEKITDGNDNISSFVTKASIINLRPNSIQELLNKKERNIIFEIPVSPVKNVQLELPEAIRFPTIFL